MIYNYIQEKYEDVSDIDKNLLVFDVTNDSIDPGIKAAQIAINDIGVKEDSPGSKTGVRVNQYLENVSCRPGLGEWSSGAVATWYKEAGLPIPPIDASSATGWYNWAKKTNRWFETPIIGSVAVYGTLDYDYDKEEDVYNAHHLGLVIQIIEEDNTIVTCENVNGEISKAIANIDSALGFIIPSMTDIKKPEISFTEPLDPSKSHNTDDSSDYTMDVKSILKDYIKEVVDRVFLYGGLKEKSRCAQGTYNQAHQFIRKLQKLTVESGMDNYHAGGYAKSSGYHKQLESKLGYTRTIDTTYSHEELANYLNNSNNWNVGDIAVYWAVSGVPSNQNPFLYGHTQLFTGGYHTKASGKWTTDVKSNYSCSFVYYNDWKGATWRFIRFNAPVSKYIN